MTEPVLEPAAGELAEATASAAPKLFATSALVHADPTRQLGTLPTHAR